MRAENLLPHQTVEKLTKWTVYDDEGQAKSIPAHNGRGPWESEDPTQEMLESRLLSTQVLTLFNNNSHGFNMVNTTIATTGVFLQTASR